MKLKNCPCCDYADITLIRTEWLNESCWMVKCSECGLMMIRLMRFKPAVARREVEDAWNKRVKNNGRHTGKRDTG